MSNEASHLRTDCVNEKEQERADQELEAQDAAGYYGGFSSAKGEIKKPGPSNPRYTEEQIDLILEALVMNGNNPEGAIKQLEQWKADGYDVRLPPTNAGITSLRSRNMDRFWEIAGSTEGAKALLEVLQDPKSPNARVTAAKEILERGYGKVTQKVELEVDVYDFADIQNACNKAIVDQALVIDGVLSDPESVSLPPEVEDEDEDGDVEG